MTIPSFISRESSEYVRGLINRLRRPIERARQLGGVRKASITNLNSFISDQIVRALGEGVLPRKIEAELLALRSLFQGNEESSQENELNQLHHAQTILDRISFMIGTTTKQVQSPDYSVSSGEPPASKKSRSLGDAVKKQPPNTASDRPPMRCPFNMPRG